MDLIKEIYQLIKRRARFGEVKELEAIKLYVETLKAQKELNKLKTGLKLAMENLNRFFRWQRFPDTQISGFIDSELHGKNKGVGSRVINRCRDPEALSYSCCWRSHHFDSCNSVCSTTYLSKSEKSIY